jgi:Na+-transporting methylmalonyl-CoA/oxaloacetate decarboxylase beta subunit
MKASIQSFIYANKVVISGALSSIILILQQAMGQGPVSFKAIGFAVFLAVLSVIAKEWKGKGFTILGIIGTMAGITQTIYETGTFTWNEFILSVLFALAMAAVQYIGTIPDPTPAEPAKPEVTEITE